jgi:putative acetyltransferase
MVSIRTEQPEDIMAIRQLNLLVFPPQPVEAGIVDQLRERCDELVSLVAIEEEAIVGHILFSPVKLNSKNSVVNGMGLAPMAVISKKQRQGIGSTLVKKGLSIIQERGYPFVVVLGHTEYYPRFGFERASKYGIRCQWDGVPDEAFMVKVLDTNEMANVDGTAYYRNEFNEAV